MAKRIELQQALLEFSDNVYFQPPSDLRMTYPCIAYSKSAPKLDRANNQIYNKSQEYKLIVIETDPDGDIADRINEYFMHSAIDSRFVVDRLHQTAITLYY